MPLGEATAYLCALRGFGTWGLSTWGLAFLRFDFSEACFLSFGFLIFAGHTNPRFRDCGVGACGRSNLIVWTCHINRLCTPCRAHCCGRKFTEATGCWFCEGKLCVYSAIGISGWAFGSSPSSVCGSRSRLIFSHSCSSSTPSRSRSWCRTGCWIFWAVVFTGVYWCMVIQVA